MMGTRATQCRFNCCHCHIASGWNIKLTAKVAGLAVIIRLCTSVIIIRLCNSDASIKRQMAAGDAYTTLADVVCCNTFLPSPS